MIPLYNAIGVLLGANPGNTFTGWVVTTIGFKLDLKELAEPTGQGLVSLQVIS